jgi:hypothetical protein
MARKPTDTAQLKLRIREELRRRLEQAAKKRDVSLNFEMTDRLKASLDREAHRTIDRVASDLDKAASNLIRYAESVIDRMLQEELMSAAEALIEQLPAEIRERKATKLAGEEVQKAIGIIAARVGRIPIHERWKGNR